MINATQVYQSIANVNLWLKLQSGDQLTLADVPAIIPLRWPYFRDNWNQLLPNLLANAGQYTYPDLLTSQLNALTSFIALERNNIVLNPFASSAVFYQYYTVFDSILIKSINLSTQENTILTNTTTAVSLYTKNDFVNLQNIIVTYRDAQADVLGLTDPTYNSTFNRTPQTAQTTPAISDIQYLSTLENSIQTIDFILANLFAVDTAVDPFAIAKANANNPDINIGQYSSGQLVRFNYGDDLESLATRYMGDPNLWINIAIANGLQPPYIDEVGQNVPLQANGSGNQVNIATTDSSGNANNTKFYINQTIFLQSNNQPFPDQRLITSIDVTGANGDLVLTLNGLPNLSQYTTAQSASVLVYAPHTINSNQFILIPSTQPLSNSRSETVPWFLASSPEDEKRAGIDLLLSQTDDLVFMPNHDLSLSYGLQNDVQAMRLKVVTELGELRYHPDFGLVNVIGSKNNNIEVVKATIIASLTAQVNQDQRFDRIENLTVTQIPNSSTTALNVFLQISLAGGSNQAIPISFDVTYT